MPDFISGKIIEMSKNMIKLIPNLKYHIESIDEHKK
jgi:hypothetical protein